MVITVFPERLAEVSPLVAVSPSRSHLSEPSALRPALLTVINLLIRIYSLAKLVGTYSVVLLLHRSFLRPVRRFEHYEVAAFLHRHVLLVVQLPTRIRCTDCASCCGDTDDVVAVSTAPRDNLHAQACNYCSPSWSSTARTPVYTSAPALRSRARIGSLVRRRDRVVPL
jgi:hypothetical protein